LSISGKLLRLPENGGHSKSIVLLHIVAGSMSPSTAQA
jgi:hypothetical protein